LNPFVVTLRRQCAARLRCLMTDRPAFREFVKIAERWRDFAEKRRDCSAELHRSGRWKLYYDEQTFLTQKHDVNEICDRWAAIVELFGWVCPLTPLENWLRQRGGERRYGADFIARYILPSLYPEELTREVQITLGVIVVLINSAIYGWILRSKRRTRN